MPAPAPIEASSASDSSDNSLNTVIDAVAPNTEILVDKAPPVPLVESAGLLPIDTATKHITPQPLIYSQVDSFALHRIIDIGQKQSFTSTRGSILSTQILGSLCEELPPRGEKMDKHPAIFVAYSRLAHVVALQTVVQKSRSADIGAQLEFDISQLIRAVKHSKQLEKAIDEVLAEDLM
jgi:hypothetical protein